MAPKSTNTTKRSLEQPQHVNRAAAQAALNVAIARERRTTDDNDQLAELITDAYAALAIAYQRASTAYTADKEMQKLGTAAVQLVTISTSYMTARSEDIA